MYFIHRGLQVTSYYVLDTIVGGSTRVFYFIDVASILVPISTILRKQKNYTQ